MKKTAKTLLGVLSISALIGTGYAMWHISGGFVGAETELTPGIETEVDKNFGLIEVTPLDGDNTINFDGVLDEDLTVKYTVKALANEGSSRDPYDLTNYDGVAEEYIPNLKITTIAKDDSGELSADDEFFNYVKLPEVQVVDYKTWLDSTCKDNGYAVTLAFNWSDELGNQNPELAWKGLTVEEQETNYNALIKALEGVKFTFKFEVGNKVDLPTVDETGEITLPTVEGSTLTIEGMKEGVVTAGEHLVTLNIEDENKVLKDSKVTITKTTIEGTETTEDLTLNESFGRATFKTYNAKYNFETGCKYSFAYELENEVIYTTVTEGEHDNVTLSYTVDDKAYTTGEELEVGKTVKVTAVANEGYTLDKVCFNGEALSLTNGTYDFVTTLDKNEVTAYATKNLEVTISLNQESTTLEVGDTLELTATVEGLDTYDLVWNSENTEVATVENGKITALKAGTTTISVYPNGYEDKIASCLVTVNEVPVIDYSISQITEAGTEYTVRGVISNISKNAFIIEDETGGIMVYGKNSNVQKGDYVEVSGVVKKFNSLLEFDSNASVVKIEDSIDEPDLVTETLTSEIALNWTTLLDSSEYVPVSSVKTYKWRATCGEYNGLTTINLKDSDVIIETYDLPSSISLVSGCEYDIVATFVSYNAKSKYAQVMVESAIIVESIPSEVSITGLNDNDKININESVQLSYTTDKSYVTVDPIWSSDNDEVISVNPQTGEITGISEGSANITIYFSDTVKATIKIFVEGVSLTSTYNYQWSINSGVIDGKILTVEFGDNPTFTIILDQHDNTSNKPVNKYDDFRIYKGFRFTITSSAKIKQISFLDTYKDDKNPKPVVTIDNLKVNSDGFYHTIDCTDDIGTNEITFDNPTAQMRFETLEIVYYVE